MADGSVHFDTAIDSTGLRTGLAKLGQIALAGVATAASAIATLGVAAVKAGIDFESAFAGVKKTVEATDEQLAQLRQEILDMSKEIPLAATEIAAIAEAAGQLGIKTEAISEFTRTMADLGVATNMTSEQAATDLARLANITQMPQDKFDELGSTVVALGNNLATTESDIVSMALRLAGTGKQVGLTEDQILSLAAAASSVGLAAELGGSAFSRVLGMMQLSAEQGGASLKAFADVAGMTSEEFKAAFEEDAAGALVAFVEGLGAAEESGKSAIAVISEMGDVAGLSTLDTVAVRDALLRAAGASDVFAESLEIGSKAWAENTALTKEAEQRYATFESRLTLLKNSASALGIAVYEGIKEPLGEAVSFASDAMAQLDAAFAANSFDGLISTLGTVLGDALAALAEATPAFVDAAFGLIGGFVQAISDNSGSIIESVIQIGLQLAESFYELAPQVMLAGGQIVYQLLSGIITNLPVIAQGAMSAIDGFVSGMETYLPVVIEKGRELLSSLGTGIRENLPLMVSNGLDALMRFATTIYDNAPAVIEAGFDLLSNLVQGILDSLPALLEKGPEIVSKFANVINDNFPTILKKGVELVGQIIAGLLQAIPTLISNIPKLITAIVDVWEAFNWLSLGKKVIGWLRDGITAMFGAVKNAGQYIADGVKNVIANLPGNLKTIGSNAMTFLKSGITGMLSTVVGAGRSVLTSIVNVFAAAPGKLLGIGKDLIKGLWNGISDMSGWVIGKIESFCKNALGAIKKFFGIKSPSRVFRDVIGKNLMLGLAQGVEDETSTAIASMGRAAKEIGSVEFSAKNIEFSDPDALYAKLNASVSESKSAITAARSNDSLVAHSDTDDDDGEPGDNAPQYIENNIHFNGQKVARVITPYVAKELEWEAKK